MAISHMIKLGEPVPLTGVTLEYGRPPEDTNKVRHLTILPDTDPRLRLVAQEVPLGTDCRQLINDMNFTMMFARGVGLAAPQVGVGYRILVGGARGSRGSFAFTLINPVRVACGTKRKGAWENCLSQKGRKAYVKRYDRITIQAYSADWQKVELRFTDFEARVVQHEMDHLDGVLMSDARV